MQRERVALIGFGAIGQGVAGHLLMDSSGPELLAVLVRVHQQDRARAALPRHVSVVTSIDALMALQPDIVIECAGQPAVHAYAADILAAGLPLMLVSTGALAADGILERLRAIATGEARLIIPAGAIAGLDGLGALKIAGLKKVTYTSTKPPAAWKGTAAEMLANLDRLQEPVTFFEGAAREAAQQFPKNANLAATVALAGLGLDQTRVRLVADPQAQGNTGRIDAESVIGTMTLVMDGAASANPKTSASTAFSILHAVRQRRARIVI